MNLRKHLIFAYLVAVIFYIDFFYTCRLLGNYAYLQEDIKEFLNNEFWYKLIIGSQGLDIIFNFFRIINDGPIVITDPMTIISMYVKGHFFSDLMTILPFHWVNRYLLFLRLIKLTRIDDHQSYIDSLVQEVVSNCLNGVQSKKLVKMYRLILYFVFMTHFFACMWILLGQRE